ncbi:MAG: FGGY family carbohydrate kinase, partial [Bacteroidota bacterium]
MRKVGAIFDIGKTNKKFFLFDASYEEVYRKIVRFPEIEDDDGFPCDDLPAITRWMQETLGEAFKLPEFDIQYLNFSGHGASLVHVDEKGQLVTPFYSYLKPFPDELTGNLFDQYGPEEQFLRETASPSLGMLNSGLQLYWLKYQKPEEYGQVKWSLHFPQYLSYLFTGIPVSDYTSIGCHTMLWDYSKMDYHQWVYHEGLNEKLAPIHSSTTVFPTSIHGKEIAVGVGIHDSSAAVLPYKNLADSPFVILSTGTWSISLNPFNKASLSQEELAHDCLLFLNEKGETVKAARLFLGNEYKHWVEELANYFGVARERHRNVSADPVILAQLQTLPPQCFQWVSLLEAFPSAEKTQIDIFDSYEMAYHKLMQELTLLQLRSLEYALG